MATLLMKDVLRFVCMESGELSVIIIMIGAQMIMLRLCADSWVILLMVSDPPSLLLPTLF